jgi:SAM-dependent methyltransferase
VQGEGIPVEVDAESGQQDCACPTDPRIARHFDAKAKRLAKGADPGLLAVSEPLKRALLSRDLTGKTVLELGCGRGVLLLDLTQAGAARATGVDLSPMAIEAARDRFEQAKRSEQAHLLVGDAARVVLEPHDWVILDRVICCYPDVDGLLANTLPAAKQIYAFAVPTSRGWRGVLARLEQWFDNSWNIARGASCPRYVHDLDLIEKRLAVAGFRMRQSGRHHLWHIAVFERSPA